MTSAAQRPLLYNLFNFSLFGVEFRQYWMDLALWEWFLNEHPDIKALIELGTGNGATSAFFLLQCAQRGIDFRTVDKIPPPAGGAIKAVRLQESFIQADIFDGDVIAGLIEQVSRPLLLFCDDGNKAREFNTFVPLLYPGDYVAVHDWTLQLNESHIEDALPLVEPEWHEQCQSLSSITRFWRRI